MGHAIAGLTLLKGDFNVYIGSYGDPKKGVNVNIGRLKLHLKYDPFLWNQGVVVSNEIGTSFWRNFIFILAGPFSSLITAIVSLLLVIYVELNLFFWWGLVLLMISSMVDFIINIRPNPKALILNDGKITFNDGQSLKMLIRYKKVYKDLIVLTKYSQQKQIKEGIQEFLKIYQKSKHDDILRAGISLYFQDENYNEIIKLYNDFQLRSKLTADDLSNFALSYSYIDEHEKAMELYDKSLIKHPNNFYSLNNRGYTLNLLARYDEAIEDFNKAISLYPKFAYAYNNRGLAKIKLGRVKEGLEDNEKSQELEPENSYTYKNLGIYFMDQGLYDDAFKNFNKANELDPKTHGLKELIHEIEKKSNKN